MKTTNLKCRIVLTALLAFSMNCFAQSGIIWKQNFGGSWGDRYFCVTEVSDGIVAVGYSTSASFNTGDWEGITGNGGQDAIIVKHDNSGNVVWKKSFGGSGADIYIYATTVPDGIVAVGYSVAASFGNGDWKNIMGKGYEDAIIVKYDNDGNVVWKRNFGGGSDDEFRSVMTVSDGVIAVGNSGAFGSGDWVGFTGNSDAIMVKYDNNGNVIWKKKLDDSANYQSVITVSDGIIAAGHSGKASMGALLVKCDNNGNVLWKKDFGGSENDYTVYESITAVSDGIVAVGNARSSSFGTGDWIGITAKGYSDYDAIIVKYDNNGNVVWKNNFGGNGNDFYRSVIAVSDGIIAAGYSDNNSWGNGDWTGVTGKGQDAIMVKYDNAGNVIWKKNFGGSGSDYYYSLIAAFNGIIVAGWYGNDSFGTGDWEGITGKGNEDAVIIKYDPTIMNGTGIPAISQDASGLIIYPNPTTGQLIINNGQLTIESVEIFDVFGRNVGANLRVRPETEITIDISHLSAGIYFVRVDEKTAKIIKN